MANNTNNTIKQKRNEMIAQDRGQGMTYIKLANKYGLTKSGIQGVLSKPELKEIIDTGTSETIALIPKAVNVHYEAMNCTDKAGNPTMLAVKAAETVLKTGAIIPSNTTNQTVNKLYLIQNNITLSAGVAKALKDMNTQDDPDVIDIKKAL